VRDHGVSYILLNVLSQVCTAASSEACKATCRFEPVSEADSGDLDLTLQDQSARYEITREKTS